MAKSIANRIKKYQDKLEINNTIASGALSFLFILTTYDIESTDYVVIYYIEIFIIINLCIDWLLFLLLADNRLNYLFMP